MAHTVTTSIRLPPNIRNELEVTSHKIHRGKNWIIIKALEMYLAKVNLKTLADEARRQSILASHTDAKENEDWEDNTDITGWN